MMKVILVINNDSDNDDDDGNDDYDGDDDDDDDKNNDYTILFYNSCTSTLIPSCAMMMNSLSWVVHLAPPQIAFQPPPARGTLALPERLGLWWDILRDILGRIANLNLTYILRGCDI